MDQVLHPSRGLMGRVALPPDKSIAHRAALFAALADGPSQIVNYPAAADPQSTLACLRQLGVKIEEEDGVLYVEGVGRFGFTPPEKPLDCGNSGTTMRLLTGILAGQPFDSVLTGDASLRGRPMERIAAPLREMGAQISLTDGGAPIHITGGADLQGITYTLPVASAQVKSCVLLAGLHAAGETTVIEPTPSRDHTERMLGMDVVEIGGARHLSVREGQTVATGTWAVPRDISAAAFFLVAGSIVPGSALEMRSVGLNPSRAGVVDVLRTMGAAIDISDEREHSFEPLATLSVQSSPLHGVTIDGALIPNLIDEIPVLAVAATQARGRTIIRDAAELRVKETDRIAAIATNLRALGAAVDTFDDGLAIDGPQALSGATLDSFGDHRIAMATAVAALVADSPTTITGAEHAEVSFPQFWEALTSVS
ncbi:MAG: 3-phosphoshikimate 1-carboxyvinyltransferase [Bacteroidetes bacterium]|jgi:3-phosphoshikimate 1-carboxyvinyltransferase|nr:3-phosphoshikimate 1-carboxyvinyltransferase [Bacteroidota bacterium]